MYLFSVLSQSFSLLSFVPVHTVPNGTVLSRDAFPGTSCQATIGVVPPGRAGRHFATASQHLAKACCELSRRDGAIVAWHEVPGKTPPKEPSRRVRCDRVRRTRTKGLGQGAKRLRGFNLGKHPNKWFAQKGREMRTRLTCVVATFDLAPFPSPSKELMQQVSAYAPRDPWSSWMKGLPQLIQLYLSRWQ